MTYRSPWTRDIAALEATAQELLQQLGHLRRQWGEPYDRVRALIIQTEAEKAFRIATRMERRYEREAAARAAEEGQHG